MRETRGRPPRAPPALFPAAADAPARAAQPSPPDLPMGTARPFITRATMRLPQAASRPLISRGADPSQTTIASQRPASRQPQAFPRLRRPPGCTRRGHPSPPARGRDPAPPARFMGRKSCRCTDRPDRRRCWPCRSVARPESRCERVQSCIAPWCTGHPRANERFCSVCASENGNEGNEPSGSAVSY